jgi:transcriptional regulator with XRE-family HTH domain
MIGALGEFLRARRARLTPGEAGLAPGGGRRRTPGLRREELATVAGVSVDYYVRLEQGRERNPSPAVLTALARALRLDAEEHAHLFALARQAAQAGPDAGEPSAPATDVRPSIRRLLATVRPSPAYVLGRCGDVLAANPEALELFAGLAEWPAERRNTVRYTFRHPAARALFPDWEARASGAVANLRTVAAEHPADPALAALVGELTAASADFAALWERHDIRRRRSAPNTFDHPEVGPLTLTFDVLRIENDQRIGLYQAEPGSPDEAALTRLAP